MRRIGVLRCLRRWLDNEEVPVVVAMETTGGREPRTFLVRDQGIHRDLVEVGARDMVHTRIERGTLRSGFGYTDALHAACLFGRRGRSRVLCLGGGGGIAARQRAALGAEVDIVEIAPEVVALAEAHFDLRPKPGLRIVCEDAWRFVARVSEPYDAILVDLFGAFAAAPILADGAFFAAARRALHPRGAIAVNVVGALDGEDGALLATRHALASAFGDVICVPMLEGDEQASGRVAFGELRNHVLFAFRGGADPPGVAPDRLRRSPTEQETRMLPRLAPAAAALDRQLRSLAAARAAASFGRPLALDRSDRPTAHDRDELGAVGDDETSVERAQLVADGAG